AKAYENDPAIIAMTELIGAYENQDANAFERVLKENRKDIEDDPFICGFIGDLRRTFRIQALEAAVLPYTSIYLGSLAKILQTTAAEVESILFELILDGRISGTIDQQHGLLLLEKGSSDAKQYEAMQSWAKNVEALMRSSYGILN
ncbi:COP9 signalosome complex subunit 2, partial [Coemansia sp. RSA 2559]